MSHTPAIRISSHQHRQYSHQQSPEQQSQRHHHHQHHHHLQHYYQHHQHHQQQPHQHQQHQSHRTPSPPTHGPPHALPMAIPHLHQSAPPPLPPPPDIPPLRDGHDLGWQWGNDANASDFGRPASVKLGSSLLGAPWREPRPLRKEDESVAPREGVDARRGSSISTITPGRDHDMMVGSVESLDDDVNAARPASNYGLRSERQLGQWTLEQTSKSYDTQLLSRIGGPNDSKRPSLSGSIHDNGPQPSPSERRHSSLRPLTVPSDHRHGSSIDSPSSWRIPSSGPISPAHTGFWSDQGSLDNRSAMSVGTSTTLDEGSSHKGSYDHAMFIDDFGPEDNQMSTLHIHDRSPGSPKAGSKRRASSPPREREDRSSVSSASGNSDFHSRRSVSHLPNRGSPSSRYPPAHSSFSSASSNGPRHGSLGSSLGPASMASSVTSYASGRLSPGASALASDPDSRVGSTYNAARGPQGPQQPTSASALQHHHHHHQRTHSESMYSSGSGGGGNGGGAGKLSADSAVHARHASSPHIARGWQCECCPKKPKRFDSEEQLRAHESEKQYTCAYCPNRFKNKNEAERHQTSLHLRPQSWSCGVLSGPEAAFHRSPTNPKEYDVCGYCGADFENPPRWDVRAEHLITVHKFRDCSSKKFFRADHFRQHLKHSHQGTSGKWTNTLENACMTEETPPVPAVADTSTATTSNLPARTRGAAVAAPPRTIEETPHDT